MMVAGRVQQQSLHSHILLGEQAQGEQAQGEQAPKTPTSNTMPARYCAAFRKAASIIKRTVTMHYEWDINWTIMGQQTIRLNGEAYPIVVLDIGSNIDAVINTRTREDPLQHLDELAELWVMMMSFICSCRNKIGAELHLYLEEGTYHKRLFRGSNTNDMKK